MPIDELGLVERLREFTDLVVQSGIFTDELVGEEAAATIERLLAERDEAVNWTETVERHGTDGFDALADTWLAMEAIKRVNNAVTSVFSKWSNDALMERFKQHITGTMHVSFVEGCLVGVKAERVNSAAAEAQRDKLKQALTLADAAIDLGLDLISDRKGWGKYQRMEGVEIYEDADKFEKAAEEFRARQALQDSKP